VCHDLIEAIEPGLMDEEISTAFLTGMIAKTKSFKTKNVTPKTLQTASKLIARGAKREHIIQNLYRTRSVSTLRLWGRALARLKTDEQAHLVWTMLSAQDFMHAGAEEHDLPDVIDELLSSSPNARVTVLLFETAQHEIKAIVRTERPLDAIALCTPFHSAGTHEEVRLTFPNKTITQTERELIDHIKKTILASQ
jgi:phosphoesterase RecJ-like protein